MKKLIVLLLAALTLSACAVNATPEKTSATPETFAETGGTTATSAETGTTSSETFAETASTSPEATKPVYTIPPFNPLTGREMMNKLQLGMNMWGLYTACLDWAPENIGGLDLELSGNGKIAPELFQAISKKGFNFVRLQVAWEPHLDKNYNIDKAWLDRIEEVANMAVDAGLYVIINEYEAEYKGYVGMPNLSYQQTETYLNKVWSQIAGRFKNHSEHIIFDVMNEPFGGGCDWNFTDEICDNVNKLNAVALKAIRESGGNNQKRIVLLPTAGANVGSFTLERYVFPDDRYCMASVHAYSPWWFCLFSVNSPERSQFDFDITKFSADGEREIKEMFKLLDDYLISKNIPFIMGEVGAINNNNIKDRVKWAEIYFSEAKKRGMPCAVHTDGGGFGFIDYFAVKWDDPEYINAVFEGYGEKAGPDLVYKFPLPYEIKLNGKSDNGWCGYAIGSAKSAVDSGATKLVFEFSDKYFLMNGWFQISWWEEGKDWSCEDYPESKRVTVSGKKAVLDITGLNYAQGISANFIGKDWEKHLIKVYLE